MADGPAPLVETTRRVRDGDGRVESRHRGHLVLVGPDGHVAAGLGDTARSTFVRSAAKPFQATVALELADRDVPPGPLAVGWASHRGEPEHLAAVTRLLALAGLGPEDLTTPATAPDGVGGGTSPLAHNCSGKHAMFALAGVAVGCRGRGVLDPDGPVQGPVLATLCEVLADGAPVPVAVDGCGAPAVAAPLRGLADAYRRLAGPEDRWAPVATAGLNNPHLVGGTGRLETALLGVGVVAKPGAEGVFAAGWRDDRGAWGLAIKVEDGASRAASVALAGFLAAVGVADPGGWDRPEVLGGGRPAGEVRPSPDLLSLAGDVADLCGPALFPVAARE